MLVSSCECRGGDYNTSMQSIRCVSRRKLLSAVAPLLFAIAFVAACGQKRDTSVIGTFRMGERVPLGPLVYTVLESDWKTTLAEGAKAPQNRFLLVRLSVTNSSGEKVNLPGFELIGPNEQRYPEVTEGLSDVPNWLGVLRSVNASETEQGTVVFDAPIGAYRLSVSDGADLANERFALVEIPVHLE